MIAYAYLGKIRALTRLRSFGFLRFCVVPNLPACELVCKLERVSACGSFGVLGLSRAVPLSGDACIGPGERAPLRLPVRFAALKLGAALAGARHSIQFWLAFRPPRRSGSPFDRQNTTPIPLSLSTPTGNFLIMPSQAPIACPCHALRMGATGE